MTDLFSGYQQAIEAACAAAWGEHHWPNVPNAENEREYMRKALTAALAALPRDALIEKAARTIAERFGFEDAYDSDIPEEPYGAGYWNHIATGALVAIGLIPEHVTPEEERHAYWPAFPNRGKRMSRLYKIRICPECGEQETHHAEHDPPATYCLNHEDEPGRTKRPAHIQVAVRAAVAEHVTTGDPPPC